MDTLWRFSELKEKRIINSRMTLKRAVDSGRLAPGRLITPNCRVWTEAEVRAFVEGGQREPKTIGKLKIA
jgi:hypothetical protein